MRTTLALLAAAVLALTGCVPAEEPTAVQPAEQGSALASPPPSTPESTSPSTPATKSTSATPAEPEPSKIRVPNVVGRNHQEAQNMMQAAGLFMLAEEDATGQGRMLILDRNWVVVRQTPKAGTRVTPETTITLYSKKIGE